MSVRSVDGGHFAGGVLDIGDEPSAPKRSRAIADRELARGIAVCASAENFREAASRLTAWLQEISGAQHVRIVVGDRHVREIWDHRIGKVKRGNSMWDKASEFWESTPVGVAPTALGFSEVWIDLDNARVDYPKSERQPLSDRRVAIWLIGKDLSCDKTDVLNSYGEAIQAALLSRPKYASLLRLSAESRGWLTWMGFVATLVLGIALFPRPYQVACNVTVHSIGERIIAAPFESTLLECAVSPGDEVEPGDLLIRLDGRPLILELEALKAEYGQASQENSSALAAGRIAESQVADLECRRIKSRMQLVQNRMDQLEVRSPIRGVIVSGDLKNAVGRPFEMGDSLLEISPLDRLKLEVEIPEADVPFVRTGDDVRTRLDAAVFAPLDGQIQRVYPQAEVREEKNCFVATWEFSNDRGFVRPGMTGKAVVYGANKPMLLRWVRPLLEGALRAIGW